MPLAWAAIVLGGILLVSGARGSSLLSEILGQPQKLPGSSPSDTPGVTDPSSADPGGASGGVAGTLQGAINSLGYYNPFQGSLVKGGRIDEGLDPTIQGPIRAIGDGKVVAVKHYSGFGAYLVYELTGGSMAGHRVYISEGIRPQVSTGQTLKGGQIIAQGTGAIETGWAGPGPTYLPTANKAQGGNYVEGAVTAAGRSFDDFLKMLGVHAGPD